MSAASNELSGTAVPSDETGLLARYDDPADPSELTLYDPAGDSALTEWLSVDPEIARPLSEMQ